MIKKFNDIYFIYEKITNCGNIKNEFNLILYYFFEMNLTKENVLGDKSQAQT